MEHSKKRNCCDCNQRSPIFCHLSDEELAFVNENRTQVDYKAGENIVKQGAPLTHVISFTSGLAKVFIEGESNKNLILNFIKPVEFIGGPGLYIDNLHHFSVTTLQPSSVCFIKIETFKELISKNSAFAESFISYISANGLFNYSRFLSLTQKNMQGRIADALIHLSKDVFVSNEFLISKYDLADFTSMSKDSVVRILKEFTNDKILEIEKDTILISKPDSLKRISQIS